MSAYATMEQASVQPKAQRVLPTDPSTGRPGQSFQLAQQDRSGGPGEPALLALLVENIADRIAAAVAERLAAPATPAAEWLDSRAASQYLGLHRDTLRRLAAERAIPAEQEGPGCKLFFRRSELDEWRRSGGRISGSLSSPLSRAA